MTQFLCYFIQAFHQTLDETIFFIESFYQTISDFAFRHKIRTTKYLENIHGMFQNSFAYCVGHYKVDTMNSLKIVKFNL